MSLHRPRLVPKVDPSPGILPDMKILKLRYSRYEVFKPSFNNRLEPFFQRILVVVISPVVVYAFGCIL